MKDIDWWWRLRREFKKTDPAAVMRVSDRKMKVLEKSIMDAVSKTPTDWKKKSKKQTPENSPNL